MKPPANAKPQTPLTLKPERVHLDYRAVMQLGRSEALPPFDEPGRCHGVAEYRGLALFPDNQVVMHRYQGRYDLTDGSGDFEGEAVWRFANGASITARYLGQARRGTRSVTFDGHLERVEGTGNFAGVRGSGRFGGLRSEPVSSGGTTEVEGQLILDLDPVA
ncbi:MAG: hypothetical protein AAGI34_04820 [Pseudomonadota bacterium]